MRRGLSNLENVAAYRPPSEIFSGTFHPSSFRARGPASTGLGSITTVVENFPRGKIPRFRDVERALISAICDYRARARARI